MLCAILRVLTCYTIYSLCVTLSLCRVRGCSGLSGPRPTFDSDRVPRLCIVYHSISQYSLVQSSSSNSIVQQSITYELYFYHVTYTMYTYILACSLQYVISYHIIQYAVLPCSKSVFSATRVDKCRRAPEVARCRIRATPII